MICSFPALHFRRFLLLGIMLMLCLESIQGQIIITPSNNGTALAQSLAGQGVTISNITFTCPNGAAGQFNSLNSNVGITDGVVLTTGLANNVRGPNNDPGASTENFAAGDNDLSQLTFPNPTLDACVLEFDLSVESDSLRFNYVFGSEEYMEWACDQFNDVFAFFISGPGIAGQQNIALVPGSNVPVSINNVNGGGIIFPFAPCIQTNTQYYVDNGDGFSQPQASDPTVIQYDGRTTVLTASAGGLSPCETYHLALKISDVGDGLLDSGVFIEGRSLTSTSVRVESSTSVGAQFLDAVEGCVDGLFTFILSQPLNRDYVVRYIVGGNSTNGVDYQTIPDSVIIPAGDTLVTLPIQTVQDGVDEQNERVTLFLTSDCNNQIIDSAVILILDSIITVATVSDDTICSGESIQLDASGGTNYSWQPVTGLSNANIPNPTASPANTITYTVSISLGTCSASDDVTVTVDQPFSVVAIPDTTLCGAAPVQLGVLIDGQLNPASNTYAWSPPTGLSSPFIPNPMVAPGVSRTYTVSVSSLVCDGTDDVTITSGTFTVASNVSPVSCGGVNDGSIQLTPSQGVPPYTFNWSNGANSATIQNLAPGNYTTTVTDNDGCEYIETYNLSAASTLSMSAQLQDITCFGAGDGSINITASGGNPAYQFAWADGSNQPNRSGLSATTYSVTITDQDNCSIDSSFTLTQPDTLIASIMMSGGLQCSGQGSADLSVIYTGGTAPIGFVWQDGNIDSLRTGMGSGAYSITVTDANACLDTASVLVSASQSMTLALTPTDPSCANIDDGTVVSQVGGGQSPYSYAWSDGQAVPNLTGMNSGIYALTVTDQFACTVADTVTLISADSIVFTLNSTNVSCFGFADANINVVASGGAGVLAISWNDGNSNFSRSGLSGGNYTFTITDTGACVSSGSLNIIEPDSLQLIVVPQNVSCFGGENGSISMQALGGTRPLLFSINGAASADSIYPNLMAGTYQLAVTDANSCSRGGTLIITEPDALSFSVSSQDASCNGLTDGAINIVIDSGGTAPYTFTLNGGAPQSSGNFSNLGAGNYLVELSDDKLCIDSVFVTINEPLAINGVAQAAGVSCFGDQNGSIVFSGMSGGVNPLEFSIDGINFSSITNFDSLSAGTYSATVRDSMGCLLQLGQQVVSTPAAVTANAQAEAISCSGAADGRSSITVLGGTAPFAGSYSADGVNFSSFGPFADTTTLQDLEGGVYNALVVDSLGCPVPLVFEIAEPDLMFVEIETEPTSCFGEEFSDGRALVSVTTDPSFPDRQPVSFSLDGGAFSFDNLFDSLSATGYDLTVRDATGCEQVIAFDITQPAPIIVTPNPAELTIHIGEDTVLLVDVFPDDIDLNYYWSPAEGLSCVDCASPIASPFRSTTYELLVETSEDPFNPCFASAFVTVIVESNPIIFIPNVFTPNGDGINDDFRIFGEEVRFQTLTIFNRWGEKVFDSNKQYRGWDGYYKGKLMNPGVYTYLSQVHFLDGRFETFKGSVTLVR